MKDFTRRIPIVLLVVILPILASPHPEAPVANYIANFYDPHPISTYGAHPFHSIESTEHHQPHDEEDELGLHHVGRNSRRASGILDHDDSYHGSSEYDHEDSNPQYNKRYPYGKTNAYSSLYSSHSEEHSPSPRSYSSSSKTAGYNNPYRLSHEGYSPSQGYIQQDWFNTMPMQGGAGYDDYGYNYDRAGSNSPAYKGPPQNNPYSSGGGGGYRYRPRPPSYTDQEDSPPSSHYNSGAPEFVSYAEEHEPKNTFSTLKGSRRPASNGYGDFPYFTFGPKKKSTSKPFSIYDAIVNLGSGLGGSGNDNVKPTSSSSSSSSGGYRPKYKSISSNRPSSSPASYYDKDNEDDEENQQEIYGEWEGGGDILHDDVDEQSSNNKDKRIPIKDENDGDEVDKQKSRLRNRPSSSSSHSHASSSHSARLKKYRRHNKRQNDPQPKLHPQHSLRLHHPRPPSSSPPPRKSSPFDLLRRLRRKSHQ